MPNKIADIFNHISDRKGFDYSQITDDIIIGTNMCCQYGFSHELLARGVRADISLEETKTDTPIGVDYYLWLPTKDHTAPTPEALTLGAQTIEFLVERKIKTYIHCKNGHGRAPTLFAAYLIQRGMSVGAAVDSIVRVRPMAHLSEAQTEALKKFKDSIKT
ncbi:MAG: dual specificity protein phosphatase family protein [Patescibacteria group bacterium]